jgi:prepilin-type N-terminal cleavage/methylation domain-containing protein
MLTKAPHDSTKRRELSSGFTLVELMIVVAIVGVLATLATYGVRKYVLEAKKAEASSMLVQIRAAEEAYKDETFQYLGLTDFTVWHPTNTPDNGKRGWESGTTTMGTNVFRPLGVLPDGPVLYSYAVVAGTVDTAIPAIPLRRTVTIPTPTAPFYIAMAMGDLDGNGSFTYAFTHSDSTEVFIEDGY